MSAGAAGGREAVGAEAGAEAEHQGGRTAALQTGKMTLLEKSPFTILAMDFSSLAMHNVHVLGWGGHRVAPCRPVAREKYQ